MSDDAFETCPTDVAHAPVERVWELLVEPARLGWVDAKLIHGPARRLIVGDRLVFAASFRLRVTWTITALEAPRLLGMDIDLPFGMMNRQTIVLSRLDAETSRVTFG
jgi:hypothetical protein